MVNRTEPLLRHGALHVIEGDGHLIVGVDAGVVDLRLERVVKAAVAVAVEHHEPW